ncbi:pentapeptide repeat-containing protein [Kribbella pratensis]|uniref:Pentapeptide repeat protein n=1 Tax=Kribbella pratensis TaxID=2512112 RepID=A0A4R8BSD8_9ACTN|nr:hypothetical protein [Kribbella pratensis]TDW60684.1 hypothetical protein EV653_7235 [Kribbella pratensis]
MSSPIRPRWQKVATAISRYPTVWILLLTILVIIAIWPVPTLLVQSGRLSETDRLKAVADTRSGVIATLTALAGAGGLAYTIATYRLGVADRLIERFENAAAQLGHRNETIRLSGLLAIAQLADESRHQRQACIDVICAHARLSSSRQSSSPSRAAALRVIIDHLRSDARVSWSGHDFDLSNIAVVEADFHGLDLTGGSFSFDGATFAVSGPDIEPWLDETVSFAGTKFAGANVTFRGATFGTECRINFDEAEFTRGRVCFDHARFEAGAVSFRAAKFGPGCAVTFDHATIRDQAELSFTDADVTGPGLSFAWTDFAESQSAGKVAFQQATFRGPIAFDHAIVDRVIDLSRAEWDDATMRLDHAEFRSGQLDLRFARGTGATISLTDAERGAGQIMLSEESASLFRTTGYARPADFFGSDVWPPTALSTPQAT